MKDLIAIRGNKTIWAKFIIKVKKEKKQVWEILSVWIKEYLG